MFSAWVFRIIDCNLLLLQSYVTIQFKRSPLIYKRIVILSRFIPITWKETTPIHTPLLIQVLPRYHLILKTGEEVTRFGPKCSGSGRG